MTSNRYRSGAVAMIAAFSAPFVAAAEDPDIGRLLASQCAQCHGTDGYAVGDIDCLAGKEVKDLFDKMRDMKRSHDTEIMKIQAKGYSDDQLLRIATYYASLPDCEE